MIEIRELGKYYNKNKVLKSISLSIEEKKTTVIIGPSGSGKSTLLRSMNLLELPEEGIIEWNGTILDFQKKLSQQEIVRFRQKTGMVFQGFHLFFHKTVLENLMEGPLVVLKRKKREVESEAIEVLRKIGLEEKKKVYPQQLSGGQQQRVAIGRAIMMKPELLLLDEPTSALDPELEGEVLQLIKELTKETYTVILVTHNMAFAKEIADHVIFLEEGRVVQEGTFEELEQSENKRVKEFFIKKY